MKSDRQLRSTVGDRPKRETSDESMTDKRKPATLSEIMARPTPPIDAETQEKIDVLESLFPEKKAEAPKHPLGEDPNDSFLSQEISNWVKEHQVSTLDEPNHQS